MKKKISIPFLSITALFLPIAAFAAQQNYIEGIIIRLLSMVVWPIFVGASVVMLIWAGILFLTAQGEPEKIQKAQKAVMWAVIGIVVAILAFSAVNIIRTVIGGPPAQQMPPAQ